MHKKILFSIAFIFLVTLVVSGCTMQRNSIMIDEQQQENPTLQATEEVMNAETDTDAATTVESEIDASIQELDALEDDEALTSEDVGL